MGLWGEEHSAQLAPEENKRRQFLFRDGGRNLLSSTTTMELGIDVGGLNGVLLGNVPPGRAGRRSDGSSVVVTFARGRAFDREVFLDFREFLRRPLRRPVVFLERGRFVRRHLYAMLLAEFFAPMQSFATGAMDAYSNMGRLFGVKAPPKWERSDPKKPDWPIVQLEDSGEFLRFLDNLRSQEHPLRKRCRAIMTGTPMENIADAWKVFVDDAATRFRESSREWKKDFLSLRGAWEEIPAQPPADAAGAGGAKATRFAIKSVPTAISPSSSFSPTPDSCPDTASRFTCSASQSGNHARISRINPRPPRGTGWKGNRSSPYPNMCRGRRCWSEERSPNRRASSNTGRKPTRMKRSASIIGRSSARTGTNISARRRMR